MAALAAYSLRYANKPPAIRLPSASPRLKRPQKTKSLAYFPVSVFLKNDLLLVSALVGSQLNRRAIVVPKAKVIEAASASLEAEEVGLLFIPNM